MMGIAPAISEAEKAADAPMHPAEILIAKVNTAVQADCRK
jgi:hypothetical protein